MILDGGGAESCVQLLKGCSAEATAMFNLTGVEVEWSKGAETGEGEAAPTLRRVCYETAPFVHGTPLPQTWL